MASAYQADGEPRIVGDIIAIHADDIDATDRLRPIDGAWAGALGQIMLAEGQRTPIEVCRQTGKGKKPWRLVSGGHRHAGACLYPDLNPLRAIEVEAGDLARRLAEISENLYRRDLEPLDRAVFVAELHDVLRARSGLGIGISPQQIAANARWKKELREAAGDASATIALAYGFTDQLVEQFGFSKRTIQYDLMLARRLSPAVQEELRGLPIAANATQLRALARLDLAEQEKVASAIARGAARSVSEAQALIAGRLKSSPEDKRLSAFIGAFARMSLAEKKGALHQLAGMLPAGFTLTTGEGA